MFSADGFNIKESLAAAEVNFISEVTPSLACMMPHAFEQKVGEECDSNGIDN